MPKRFVYAADSPWARHLYQFMVENFVDKFQPPRIFPEPRKSVASILIFISVDSNFRGTQGSINISDG